LSTQGSPLGIGQPLYVAFRLPSSLFGISQTG
jgi:hypothetical protein